MKRTIYGISKRVVLAKADKNVRYIYIHVAKKNTTGTLPAYRAWRDKDPSRLAGMGGMHAIAGCCKTILTLSCTPRRKFSFINGQPDEDQDEGASTPYSIRRYLVRISD